jgi:hypothetical protein
VVAHAPDAEPAVTAGGYGYGLFVLRDAKLGTTVSHAGGYPGCGTHMAWHPATGLGVIGLGNVRYAPVRPVVAEMLAMLVRSDGTARRVVPCCDGRLRPIVDGPSRAGRRRGGPGVRDEHGPDEPRELRRRGRGGRELLPAGRAAISTSPAVSWWLRRGWAWSRSRHPGPEPAQTVRHTASATVPDVARARRRVLAAGQVTDCRTTCRWWTL